MPDAAEIWDEARAIISAAIEERFVPGCLTDARAAIDVAAPAVAEALAARDHTIAALRAQPRDEVNPMSGLPEDTRLAALLDLHQVREDGRCSQCRATWPCTTYITLTGHPRQTGDLARNISGLLPMADTLLGQVDQIATRHIDPVAFDATCDILTGRHPDSAALRLLLDLIRTRSASLHPEVPTP